MCNNNIYVKGKKNQRQKSENNIILPLNRFGYFDSFVDQISPNGKVSFKVTLESDDSIIFRGGADDGRFIVTRFLLWVPKIAFNSFGKQTFFDEYLKPHTWSYLKERLGISPGGQQKQATFKLNSSIRKLRRVFIRALNDAKFNDQTQNMFIFNTYTIGRNRKITSA